jgi:hypothetical protein
MIENERVPRFQLRVGVGTTGAIHLDRVERRLDMGIRLSLVLLFIVGGLFGGACGDDGGNTCPVGSEGCPCTSGGSCDGALVCASNVCVNLGADADADADADTGADADADPGADADGDGDADIGSDVPPVVCGDGTCDPTENCSHCSADCGACEAVFSCGGAPCTYEECVAASETCSFVACDAVSGPPLYFADDFAASTACADLGVPVAAWMSERHCFANDMMIVPFGDDCRPEYAFCPCTDGYYQWTIPGWGAVPGPCGDVPTACTCTPHCTGRACGPDGCGGSCGGCPTGQSCNDGACGSSSDACSACLAGCAGTGDPLCCMGYGCYCYGPCVTDVPCPEGTELCCSDWGDCMCMPPSACPY